MRKITIETEHIDALSLEAIGGIARIIARHPTAECARDDIPRSVSDDIIDELITAGVMSVAGERCRLDTYADESEHKRASQRKRAAKHRQAKQSRQTQPQAKSQPRKTRGLNLAQMTRDGREQRAELDAVEDKKSRARAYAEHCAKASDEELLALYISGLPGGQPDGWVRKYSGVALDTLRQTREAIAIESSVHGTDASYAVGRFFGRQFGVIQAERQAKNDADARKARQKTRSYPLTQLLSDSEITAYAHHLAVKGAK